MLQRPANWFLNTAMLAGVVALIMVPAMEWLQHEHLPWWVHIPATAVVLGLLSLGAVAAGAAYMEYRARSTSRG